MPSASKSPLQTKPRIDLSKVDLPSRLPDDLDALKVLLHAQRQAFEDILAASITEVQREAQLEAERKFEERIRHLIEQIELARHRTFAASSEQLPGQSCLFDEAEVLAQDSTEAQNQAPVPAPSTTPTPAPKAKPKRGKARQAQTTAGAAGALRRHP